MCVQHHMLGALTSLPSAVMIASKAKNGCKRDALIVVQIVSLAEHCVNVSEKTSRETRVSVNFRFEVFDRLL
jgi:hypothetical protein